MRKRIFLTSLAATMAVILAAGSIHADEDESGGSRWNPIRFIQRLAKANDDTREIRFAEIRVRLEEEGLDLETIEQRIAEIEAKLEERQPPTLDEIRAKLEARGLEPEKIDKIVEKIGTARQRGKKRGLNNDLPTIDELRARLERNGLEPEKVDRIIEHVTAARDRGRGNGLGRNGRVANVESRGQRRFDNGAIEDQTPSDNASPNTAERTRGRSRRGPRR